MRKSKNTVEEDALKAVRRIAREDEIAKHGHPISYSKVFRNRKKYYRKQKHKKWEY